MHAAKAFFGRDEVAFSLVSTAPGAAGATRHYARFTDVVRDVIDVRVYHGVHFRTADVQGAQIGQDVAEWIAARHFQPRPPRRGLPATGAGGGGARLPAGWLALAAGGALVAVAAGGRLLLRLGARRA